MDRQRQIELLKDKWWELNSIIATGYESDRQKGEDLLFQIDNLNAQIRSSEIGDQYGFGSRNPIQKPDVGFGHRSKGKVFSSFGDQLMAVYKAAQPGQEVDRRLYQVDAEMRQSRAALGLSETSPADGGFLVEQAFSNELLDSIFTTGKLASLCRQIPIGNSNSIKIPALAESSRATGLRLGGIQAYWLGEAGTKTASAPKFRQLELNLKKLIGLCYTTDELIQDVSILENIIRKGFTDEFGFMVEDSILNGTGVGQPLGILNSSSLVALPRIGAGSIATADIYNLWARVIDPTNCYWVLNQDLLPTLYALSLSVGTAGGALVFQPAGGLSATPYATLMGRPIIISENASTIGTKGDILLGNFGEGYIIVSKPVDAAISMHCQFVTDQQAYRSTKQAAYVGNSIMKQPPKRGNLSPFGDMAIPCQAAIMSQACVTTIQRPTYLNQVEERVYAN